MKKYLVEFIGTFFLVLIIGLASKFAGNLAPVAIGFGLMVMVYAGGHISGAHYNPAVSVAIFIRGLIDLKDLGFYIIAQLLGAVVASLVIIWYLGEPLIVAPNGASYSGLQIVGIEAIFTFALAYVVLNVATHPKTTGNSYYGLAIGLTVTAAAYCNGGISGGAFNPAVGCGPNLVLAAVSGGNGLLNMLTYTGGPVLGAALAGFVYKYVNAE